MGWRTLERISGTGPQDLAGRPRAHRRADLRARSAPQELTGKHVTGPRESEVLALLSEGNSGAVIAERLCISNTTVRNHIQHIQKKLGVHSQAEAIAYSYRHNFL